MRRAALRLTGVGIALAVLHGCGGPAEEPDEESVFDSVLQPMDRAEDVQRIVDQQAEELRRRLEEAEGR